MRFTRLMAALILAVMLLMVYPNALSDNLPPLVNDKEIHTVQNVPVWGYVEQYDPDGDAITLNVVQEAGKGMVTVYDATFVYRPFADEMGEDSFTVLATDSAGNYSRQATVTVQIEQNKMGDGFSDMRLHPSHYSALMLAQNNLVSGERVGDSLLFQPDRQMTQSDFMLMVLAVADTTNVHTPCVSTDLPNDKDIALWLKPYLRTAKRLGLIGAGEFYPDTPITRAEAVQLISRATGMQDVEAQALHIRDLEKIPAESLQSYINLAATDMLSLYDGYARPDEPLTRAAAADLVWQLYRFGQQQSAQGTSK